MNRAGIGAGPPQAEAAAAAGKGRPEAALTVASLLSILLLTFHLADDTVQARVGTGAAGSADIPALLILAVWLYGTFPLAGRRSGHVIMFLGGVLGVVASVVHMMGNGMTAGRATGSAGTWAFVWTTIALGATGMFSALLAARALWRGRGSWR